MNKAELLSGLRLPLMAAPMSIASNRALVSAAIQAGVMACFPTHNAARDGGLALWVDELQTVQRQGQERGEVISAFAVNINVSRAKPRALLTEEIAVCRKARLPVITSNAGDPSELVKQVHDWGGLVIHDATTVEQAERAIAAGVDGLMLVCAGAGGLGGLLSPFAFVPKVRRMFDGIIQLAGGVADGVGIAAAQTLGADMVCMGTRFIATVESGVDSGHKQMLTESGSADVLWTDAICGIAANFLKASIRQNGLDPASLLACQR
ncbi:nitronate monooxygenase [Pseudomonas asiatica]|uniref:NAD(P)H-dependent flavin oxidoreductase n=1 Tax=Pseudomonas asiatica TaxID=2219225 RepID=UPI002E7AF8E4|nr:nitronate monooxygenase [Pseudomonas asiatica]MEE1916340.1 nitronate monooxygenase [Pseudomonas asiatica]